MDIFNFLVEPIVTLYNQSGLLVTLLAGYGAICFTKPIAKWVCYNSADVGHETEFPKDSKIIENQKFDFKSNNHECELGLTKTFKNK